MSQTSGFGTTSRVNHNSSKYYGTKMYSELVTKRGYSVAPDNLFPADYLDKVILGSSEDMAQLPDNCVHLMVTSPPYNASKEYDDDLSLDEYLQMLLNVFTETYRVLVDGGRACVNVANLGRKPYIPLADYISHIMIGVGFNMRGEIIWSKGAGAGVSMAWGSWCSASNPVLRDTHEYILVFSKGSYGRKTPNRPSTISKKDFMAWTKSVWSMNTASARKIGHPAPFPVELPHRLIQLYTFQGDIVLDPFIGSGSTAIAAKNDKRHYVGYDVSAEYVALAESRVKAEAKVETEGEE